jgi:hypothetical protein
MSTWDLNRKVPKSLKCAAAFNIFLLFFNIYISILVLNNIHGDVCLVELDDKDPIDKIYIILLSTSLFLLVLSIMFLLLILKWTDIMKDSYDNLDEFNISNQDDHIAMYNFMAISGVILGLMFISMSLTNVLKYTWIINII